MKLINEIYSGEHKEVFWSKNGLLCRKWNDETNDYYPEQMRIINKTISFTTDNWKTVKTAIGEYHYADPKTGKIVETYGVNAETLIGKLILGEELIMTNSNGSMEFNDSGLSIDTTSNGGFGFHIKKNGKSVLYADTDGNLVLKGYVYADGGVFKGDVEADSFSLKKTISYEDYEGDSEFANLAEYRIGADDARQSLRNGLYIGVMFPTDGDMGSYNYYMGSGIVFSTTPEQSLSFSGTTSIFGGTIEMNGDVSSEYTFTAKGESYFEKNVNISGDLTVNGTKSRLVDTNDGNILLHAYETATPYFGDIGIGTINSDGFDVVPINHIFGETVNTNVEYSVFLQKEGQGDLWVDTKDPLFFIVNGTPGLKYSWELKAVQRDYECVELTEYDSVLSLSSNDSEDTEVINILDNIVSSLDQEEVWIN